MLLPLALINLPDMDLLPSIFDFDFEAGFDDFGVKAFDNFGTDFEWAFDFDFGTAFNAVGFSNFEASVTIKFDDEVTDNDNHNNNLAMAWQQQQWR